MALDAGRGSLSSPRFASAMPRRALRSRSSSASPSIQSILRPPGRSVACHRWGSKRVAGEPPASHSSLTDQGERIGCWNQAPFWRAASAVAPGGPLRPRHERRASAFKRFCHPATFFRCVACQSARRAQPISSERLPGRCIPEQLPAPVTSLAGAAQGFPASALRPAAQQPRCSAALFRAQQPPPLHSHRPAATGLAGPGSPPEGPSPAQKPADPQGTAPRADSPGPCSMLLQKGDGMASDAPCEPVGPALVGWWAPFNPPCSGATTKRQTRGDGGPHRSMWALSFRALRTTTVSHKLTTSSRAAHAGRSPARAAAGLFAPSQRGSSGGNGADVRRG